MTIALSPVLGGAPRINLMPRSELDRRSRERLTRGWVWGVLGAILVALLIIAAAFWLKWSADQRLAEEQARTNALLIEVSSLAPVSQALATEAELTEFRSLAMAADLAWGPVVTRVVGVLPSGTDLTGFNMSSGGVPGGDDPTVEPGLTGTFTVESPTALDIVGIIRSLRGVEGVLSADGQSVTASTVVEGRFSYLLTVTFDQTVYSNAFAIAEEEEG
jgi:hypothetical protein